MRDAKAQEIWLHMVKTLQKTDAAYKAAPTVAGSPRKDLSADAFKQIMGEFEPITTALRPYMEKYAQGKKTWAFWSGKPAVEVAKKHSEVCLEKSALGGLFDIVGCTFGDREPCDGLEWRARGQVLGMNVQVASVATKSAADLDGAGASTRRPGHYVFEGSPAPGFLPPNGEAEDISFLAQAVLESVDGVSITKE